MPQTADTRGYAIIDRHGKILIRTTAPEQRGAIINWLVVYARIKVRNEWPDEMVQTLFDGMKTERGVRVAHVIVSEISLD